MEEEISRMERFQEEIDTFLDSEDTSLAITAYKKEAKKLKKYIGNLDTHVESEIRTITAEKVIFVIRKEEKN